MLILINDLYVSGDTLAILNFSRPAVREANSCRFRALFPITWGTCGLLRNRTVVHVYFFRKWAKLEFFILCKELYPPRDMSCHKGNTFFRFLAWKSCSRPRFFLPKITFFRNILSILSLLSWKQTRPGRQKCLSGANWSLFWKVRRAERGREKDSEPNLISFESCKFFCT